MAAFLLMIGLGLSSSASIIERNWKISPKPAHGMTMHILTSDNDTLRRFSPRSNPPQTLNDIVPKTNDLRQPENIKTEVFYDEKTGTYRLGTKIGDNFLDTPFFLTEKEYERWTIRRSLSQYFRDKNAEAYKAGGKNKFDFTDMKFDLGPMNRIFGPGGVRIKTQGSAELKLGGNTRFTDNPSLSERNRKVFSFDFDEKINLSLNASVGDKVKMDFSYNSEATFNYDTQNLKLGYEGKEDEIIKLIEAGNVSFPSNNSLVRGASSLFGVRADMQFGKLKLQTVVSQKKSSSSSISSKGRSQLSFFEFSADAYDENRHFFLAHFFRDHYDENMSQLPNIMSGVTINRCEIWVTNKTGATNNTRNIVALTDLGESRHIKNSTWTGNGSENPSNSSNTLYATLNANYSAARDITQTTSVLDGAGLEGGVDYEKLETARLLSSSEYKINASLGYISLKSTLQTDQVLAVAFEYTYRGQTFQVGEFSTDRKTGAEALFVKSLKNTAGVPSQGNWPLMMKNVYALGASNIQKENFRLDIKLLNDTSGVYLSYIPEPTLKDKKIIQLLGLDRLDNNNRRNPNGYFDYVEGYTIDASNGRIFFPVIEPFGEYMRKAIADETLAEKYIFQELYDSTKTIARQIAERDKYTISGQYKGSQSGEISLGAMNIPPGSVVVTAGGVTLSEGSDYTVDYNSGIVHIINTSLLDAGTAINVSFESNTDYGMLRKTMFGLNWQYDFSKNFQIGGTLMHLGEKPLTTKVSMGSEPLNNTIWGLNIAWKKQSQWLTNLLNALPLLNCTAPSSINLSVEFAQLVAGKNKGSQGDASYIDDFESTKSEIDISNPTEWMLCSTPSMFPEQKYSNDIRYGYNRAKLAWYYIDPLFTRRSSSLTPGYIKSNLDMLSDHDVREVYKSELFPNKSINYKESATLSILNLAYYPNERGPYNLDTDLTTAGKLKNPSKRWGGMMRKLDISDFKASNIQYIEFWMMDPFIKMRETGDYSTGDLYINLGEISEDVLKDGKKFYESGMPIDGDPALYTETVWGRVPNTTSITYAFNTSGGSRQKQDIGLNGLSSEEERDFGIYKTYLQTVRGIVRPEVYDSIAASPSADRYHYFRGSDFDAAQTSILDRYKDINNPNGNSADSEHSPESYSTAYKTTPDVEDINQDYTLNEYEKYYQYRVRIDPIHMEVGQNYIVDKREAIAPLRNGEKPTVTWYQFRIPVDQFERNMGGISDFSSIRFMRVFMTGFEKPIILRLATFNLVHGEWRVYDQQLTNGQAPEITGTISASAVNFEENNDKTPVNYVLPPGISRVIDPGQDQVLQNDEQALSLTVENLAGGDARAVYKNMTLDLRNYRHLQMFTHANALVDNITELEDGQISVFIRMGSDYKSNYYEYEIPLKLTPHGQYSSGPSGQLAVWPAENMLDIDLSLLTDIKKKRNRQKVLGLASYTTTYSEYDSKHPANKVTVMGNPSLGEVRTMMIGVRNNARSIKSGEVWVNELRLQEYTNKGGWAARGALNVQLSDVASVNAQGHYETDGFGGLEEGIGQRRDDELLQYSVSTNVELGRFLPEKVKLKAPLYYSYSKERTTPRYNPLDTDLSLDDALDGLADRHEEDSLRNIAQTVVVNKNLSLSGIRFDIKIDKRHPLPIDPTNFTFSYAMSYRHTSGETTAWEKDLNKKWGLNYNYSPSTQAFEPFKKINSKTKWGRIAKDFGFNYLPQNLSFTSDIQHNYYEFQERDIENLENNTLPLSWASDFIWNRSLTLRWDLTKSLHASFNSGTNAEIVQPYTPVNKDLYPDHYTAWKDSIWSSMRKLGEPLTYAQTFDSSWKLPLNKLPLFDWMTTDVKYNSTYNWSRGASLDNGTSLGGTIAMSRTYGGNARLNLETLYNHSSFLKKVNRKFSGSSSSANKSKTEQKRFEKEIRLQTDTTLTVRHGQKSKKLRVTAIRPDGTRYPIRFRTIDQNNIEIITRDTAQIKISIVPRKQVEDQKWYKATQYTARALMMLRSISVSYNNKFSMSVPGFIPMAGDYFGQGMHQGLTPGLDFAFGFVDDSYISRAANRGWLIQSDSIQTPASTSATEDLQIRASIEPFRDFKIELNASRNVNKTRSIQYMFDGMPYTQSGSFTMTTISLRSAFSSSGNAENGYTSKTFNKFVGLLDLYRNRIEQRYLGSTYPAGTELAGKPFNPANGTVDRYASEVMIPAFLEAYCGDSDFEIFPSLRCLLPNWTLSYAGLSKLARMKKVFKSFNLRHAYKSVYSVGSYSTFTSFHEYMDGYGFVSDVTTGLPVPSSMFDISTVSLNESFSPLFGVDMTFLNNLTAKAEFRRTRVLSLSMTSQRLTETHSNDWVIGLGYKIQNLQLFQPKKTVRSKSKTKRKTEGQPTTESTTNSRGFASDLNLRLDLTWRNQTALNRDISTLLSQATSGNKAINVSFSADYALSRYLTLTAYYDRQFNKPLLTSSSYPITTQDFGLSLRFTLNR